MQINVSRTSLAAALAGVFVLAACSGANQPTAPGAGAPRAPVVTVVTVKAQPVPIVAELPGRTSPSLVAEIRPQVTGIVKARAFREGSEVKAGAPLYQIDPSTYQAAYDSAAAALANAEANQVVSRQKATRIAELVAIEAVSKQAHDDAVATVKQAEAAVASARAALDKARIDLGFTRLSAPIAGRIGRSAVTSGALVTANQEAALATVQQLDPIYVDVTQSSADLLRLRRELAAGSLRRSRDGELPVSLVLEDGSVYGAQGRLAFSEVAVDEGTGSVTLRAVFPNPAGELLPGMYVRARLEQGVRGDAILVPHAGVGRDARGNPTVMVVNADSKVEARPVKTERSLDDQWVVTEGLAPGDRVIVEGLQRVRPGAQVEVEEAGTPPAAVAAAAAR